MNMENRKEIRTMTGVTELPEARGVRLLYDNERWRGPVEGMCELDGERLYFLCVTDIFAAVPRRYALVRLTEEQAKIEAEIHALYVEKVGDFWEYEDGVRKDGTARDEGSQAEFWEELKRFPTYCVERSQVVGWFGL